MKLTALQAAIGSASVLFSTSASAAANHGHRHAHEQYGKRHGHLNHTAVEVIDAPEIEKRGAPCYLPDHPDLVKVPGAMNNGFAMSPDEPCVDGKWCPFACVPGKVMAQWDPDSRYVYPQSMNGGLYCKGGKAEKPFPNSPYCVDGTGSVKAVNKCGKVVSFCQTVLPGNEAMLIPTDVDSSATLAVPSISYWDSTAAHYYINPPGVSSSEGCIWGGPSKPIGNWSPYVAGANTDGKGQTFLKIAWNPIFTDCPLREKTPTFGVKIECPDGGCNGLPCSINPATDGGVNGLSSPVGTVGVGGATFCVVTVPKGKTANIVVFNIDGSEGPVVAAQAKQEPKEKSSAPAPPPTTSSTSTKPTSAPKVETTSSSSPSSSSSSVALVPSSSSEEPSSSSSASASVTALRYGGIFHENSTFTGTIELSAGTTAAPKLTSPAADSVAPVSTTSKNEGGAADQSGTAIAGLIVALMAAAAMY
ncbi:hypothetical protein B0H63DRAFT_129789 [Podospora didyma]|uniref:Uncharacterized protein n=1 Tax=Podospora didyma TaxID=330526 RepID=A0AAE0P0D7_9PEZI|nr:hypothetical protein B0H63DRAFT_129789 [Podospora didyma]